MPDRKKQVEELVRAFGGLTAMSRALGHRHPSTVQGWLTRGAVPYWRFNEIRNSKPYRRDPAIAALLAEIAAAPQPPRRAAGHARTPEHDPTGCRHIDGDPRGDWAYCNAPQLPGSPYCAAHHALCRIPADRPDALAAIEAAARGRR